MEGRSIYADSTNIHFGKDSAAFSMFENILTIEDKTTRCAQIDNLVAHLEKNADNKNPNEGNGFYSKNKAVYISKGPEFLKGPQFKIDDNIIYYIFADHCRIFKNMYPDACFDLIVHSAVTSTLKSYFGIFDGDNNEMRLKIFSPKKIDDENYEAESISKIRGLCFAQCTEKASVAQNLWIMAGRESYCIDSTINFSQIGICDENHQFIIVKGTDNIFRLFDYSMEYATILDNNPIDEILNGKTLKCTNNYGRVLEYCNINEKQSNK